MKYVGLELLCEGGREGETEGDGREGDLILYSKSAHAQEGIGNSGLSKS